MRRFPKVSVSRITVSQEHSKSEIVHSFKLAKVLVRQRSCSTLYLTCTDSEKEELKIQK